MNDDYLWDRSGEPDPEIQQLEEILGTLRYQPKPLKIAPRRNYLALLAIAATVLISVIAGGLWLQVKNQQPSIPSVAIVEPENPVIGPRLSVSQNSPKKHKPIFVKQNQQEALAAKQQLMLALRLASEKLNSAYRRTQTPAQIKNQHRAG